MKDETIDFKKSPFIRSLWKGCPFCDHGMVEIWKPFEGSDTGKVTCEGCKIIGRMSNINEKKNYEQSCLVEWPSWIKRKDGPSFDEELAARTK